MIIEMLTPLMLATAPIRIDVEQPKYDHVSQKNETVVAWSTYGGTRTFDYRGQPSDNDSD